MLIKENCYISYIIFFNLSFSFAGFLEKGSYEKDMRNDGRRNCGHQWKQILWQTFTSYHCSLGSNKRGVFQKVINLTYYVMKNTFTTAKISGQAHWKQSFSWYHGLDRIGKNLKHHLVPTLQFSQNPIQLDLNTSKDIHNSSGQPVPRFLLNFI